MIKRNRAFKHAEDGSASDAKILREAVEEALVSAHTSYIFISGAALEVLEETKDGKVMDVGIHLVMRGRKNTIAELLLQAAHEVAHS